MLPQSQLAPQPHITTRALRSPRGLATATSVLLGAVAVTDLFALYAGLQLHLVAGDFLDRGPEEIDRTDLLYQLSGYLQMSGTLATAVVFIIWFFRVRSNADLLAPDVCTRNRGWAIGGWFIPVGNLWLPFGVARETWVASTQHAPDGAWRTVSQWPIRTWWGTWIAALFVYRGGTTMASHATTPEAIQRSTDVVMLADALNLAAALFAILFVRRLTAMQHRKATEGPNASV